MKDKIRFEEKKALDKLLDNVGQKNNKWIREANRISARPGDNSSFSFSVQSICSAPWMKVQRKLSIEPYNHPLIEEYVT